MSRAVTVIFLVCLATAASAEDKPKASAADRLAAIQKEHKDAEAKFREAAEALPENDEGRKKFEELYKEYDKGQTTRFLEAVKIAKAEPKSDAGFAALEWVLTIPRTYTLPAGKQAMELMTENHAANTKIGKTIAWLGSFRPRRGDNLEAATALVEAVAKKNRDQTARGQAVIAIAWRAKDEFAVAEYKKSADVDKLAEKAEKAFEVVVKDYADCRRLIGDGKRTLGEEAKQELFELRNLRIGKAAPEIKSEDLDGKKFALSDYRGKVVVLVFTGSWCGPCRAMYPHERELMSRLKDKPFALIGVNSDEDRAKAKKHMADEKNEWRSFWNGPDGPRGPIARAWNVRSWPSIFVLDHKGTIRHKGLHDKQLDEAVDALLEELNKEAKKK